MERALSFTFDTHEELPLGTQLSAVEYISGRELGIGRYFSAMAMQAELSTFGLSPELGLEELVPVPESEEQAKINRVADNAKYLQKVFIAVSLLSHIHHLTTFIYPNNVIA